MGNVHLVVTGHASDSLRPSSLCSACQARPMALCGALDCHEMAELDKVAVQKRMEPDEVLFQEGDPRRRVYTVTEGIMRISLILADGRRQITGFLMPGDFIGLADEDIYSANVEAVTACTLCTFSVAEMDRFLVRFPALRDRLLSFTRSALRQARDSQIMLGRLAPVEKLSSFIMLLSARAVRCGNPANPVHLPMSRADIADYLGLTIETVSRSFTKLRNQGLIRLNDAHMVEIVNMRALAAVAGLEPH